jgi:hypothetical protein
MPLSSHPKPFKCSVTVRNADAETLIRSVVEEYTAVPTDAGDL